jgi:hypothetical protein
MGNREALVSIAIGEQRAILDLKTTDVGQFDMPFSYSLFGDAVSSSDYIASSES